MPENIILDTINAMSVSEKLLFRRAYTGKKVPAFIILYDEIVKTGQYDEPEVKKKMKTVIPEKTFTYTKHILLNKIHEAMALHLKENDEELNLLYQLMIIRALRIKGRINQAVKIWKKSFLKAKEQEYFSIMLLLLDEYIRIELFNSTTSTIQDINETVKISKPLLASYERIVQLQSLYMIVLNIRRKSNIVFTDNEKKELISINIMLDKIYSDEDKDQTHSNFYLMTKATIHYLQGDFEIAFGYLNDNIYIWQNNAKNIIADVEYYLDALFLYSDVGILLKKFDDVKQAIEHSCNNYLTGDYAKNNFEVIKFRNYNRIYNKQAQYHQVQLLITASETKLDSWLKFVNNETKTVLLTSFCIASFVLKKYNDAIYYAKQMQQSFVKATRQEYQTFTYLFVLAICYESKNVPLFESQYRNAYTHFYRHKNPLLFEKKILQVLYTTYKNRHSNISRKKMEKLLDELERNSKDSSQQLIFNMFNFPLWIKSIIEKKAYVEKVKEMNA